MFGKKLQINKNNPWYVVMEYVQLLVGSLIAAYSFNVFLAPNQIASGGVVGISVVTRALWGFEPAITQWLLNIPLFLIGLYFLGGKFGLKTAFGSFILPLLILLTRNAQPLTQNPLLAAVYGGIGIGAGLGLVFRCNASVGGLSILSRILQKYLGISIGMAMMVMDGLVILSAGLVFTAEKALYALIVVFVTGKAIDLVQLGFSTSKVAFVVSDESQAICEAVLHELPRGVTRLPGIGGYTNEDREVLMVVMNQGEVVKFKNMVKTLDPHAFIIISETHEVLGQGFKLHA